MLRYYQRVNKSEEFKFGSKPIEFDENPLLEGPCFLCISANYEARIGDAPKSNFGASKLGMQIARLRTSDKINAKYGLKDFPVKFLTLQLDTSNEQDRTLEEARKERKNLSIPRTEDLVNRSFFPLISKDGKRIDCKQAMKNLRNVNILVFCDGMLLLQDIEKMMIEKMKELCYSEAECAQILS